MKKISGFWVDENNNTWDIRTFTEPEAEKHSAALINCQDCQGCQGCRDCWNCRGFSDNPQRYTTARIGSRNDQTVFYWLGNQTAVVCGCFRGTLDGFEERVINKYDPDTTHGRSYRVEIEKVRYLMGVKKEDAP